MVLLSIPVAGTMESAYTGFVIKEIKVCYSLNHKQSELNSFHVFSYHVFFELEFVKNACAISCGNACAMFLIKASAV